MDNNIGNPVIVEILDHFLDVPPCRFAELQLVQGVDFREGGGLAHEPDARIFDTIYMSNVSPALELWLMGVRKDVKLPAGVCRDHGESRLEQLAYHSYEGRPCWALYTGKFNILDVDW